MSFPEASQSKCTKRISKTGVEMMAEAVLQADVGEERTAVCQNLCVS